MAPEETHVWAKNLVSSDPDRAAYVLAESKDELETLKSLVQVALGLFQNKEMARRGDLRKIEWLFGRKLSPETNSPPPGPDEQKPVQKEN